MTDLSEHTILVAFTVYGDTRESAQRALMDALPQPGSPVTSWWIAEDERYDGSDCDSAIFVPRGAQSDIAEQIQMWMDYKTDEWEEEGYPWAETDVSGAWWPKRYRTCVLTGAEGENPDDCTTHEHTESR